jgi:signal transduction histidine kinase
LKSAGLPAEHSALFESAIALAGQMEQENARLAQQLRETQKARAKFVSVVTHELRLPMTSIKGYTDLLRTGAVGPLNEQQTSFLNVIRNNVDRMSALVSDLSDLAHLESGRVKFNTGPVRLREVLDDLLLTLQPRFTERQQTLEIDLPAALPPLAADRSRLAQVLSSLLNNANRYTPEGGRIQVRAFEQGDRVRVEVTDNGAGISEKDQGQIFTQFFRSEEPAVREQPGWGLNLSVARPMMEGMGGELAFTSEHAKGSTFWFTLPSEKQA